MKNASIGQKINFPESDGDS